MKFLNKLESLPKFWAFTLTLFVGFILTYAIWGDQLLHADAYLFGPGGDGLKNYYTPAYTIAHSEGTAFNGMWYPYGEKVWFLDAQPLISIPLRWLNNLGLPIAHNIIGIINLLMLLNVILGAGLIYLILRKLLLPNGWAIACALCIAFLSPQLHRFTGHYALAWVSIVPLFILLLLQVHTAKQNIKIYVWAAIMAAITLATGYMHAYWLLMGAFFSLSFAFIGFLQQHFSHIPHKQKNKALALIAAALLPVIIFRLHLYLSDGATDRHMLPYGLTVYRAYLDSFLLPGFGAARAWWDNFIKTSIHTEEGWGYIGFVGLTVLLITLLRALSKPWKKRKNVLFGALPNGLSTLLWASLPLLLFAMGLPYIIAEDWLTAHLPKSLLQFRGLGRFIFIFYYVFSIYTAVITWLLYRLLRQKNLKKLGGLFLFYVLLFWGAEALVNTQWKQNFIEKWKISHLFYGTDDFNYTHWLQESGYTTSDFQAILAFPYFNLGSEEIQLEGSGAALFEACKASFDTGLPMVQGYSSRTPMHVMEGTLRLMSHDLISKEKTLRLMDERPLLLCVPQETLSDREKQLVSRATVIKKDVRSGMLTNLYALPISAFTTYHTTVTDSLHTVFTALQTQNMAQHKHATAYKDLYVINKDTTRQAEKRVYFNSFDDSNKNDYVATTNSVICPDALNLFTPIDGESFACGEGKNLELYNASLPNAKTGDVYEYSIWLPVDRRIPSFPIMRYEEFNHLGERAKFLEKAAKQTIEIYNGWVRVALQTDLTWGDHRVRISLGSNKKPMADSFLIRPIDADVYRLPTNNKQNTISFWYNNYPVAH